MSFLVDWDDFSLLMKEMHVNPEINFACLDLSLLLSVGFEKVSVHYLWFELFFSFLPRSASWIQRPPTWVHICLDALAWQGTSGKSIRELPK